MKEKEIGDIACDVNVRDGYKFSTLENKVISINVIQKLRITSINLITFKKAKLSEWLTANK